MDIYDETFKELDLDIDDGKENNENNEIHENDQPATGNVFDELNSSLSFLVETFLY